MITTILTGATALLALTSGVWYLMRRLRGRGRAQIAKRFPAEQVLLTETLAQSYGQQSRGVTQVRGSGALALTSGELFFQLYLPQRELRIPLESVKAVSIARSHLGKTGGAKLLHVVFTHEGVEDAIAWRLPDPDAWKAKIDGLRA